MARPRRLIVDAWNVLHVTGVLTPELAGPDLAGLADLIASSRWGRLRTTLVCDGSAVPTPGLPPGVLVRFAGPGSDADSVIEGIIERDSAPRLLRVVSSDRRLQRSARRRRAGWMTSEEFLRRLNLDAGRPVGAGGRVGPTKPTPPTDHDGVGRWLERMGVRPDDPIRAIRSAAGRDASLYPAREHGPAANPEPTPRRADPVLEAAFKEWRGRLDEADLDMARWTPDAEPLRRDRDHSPPSQ